MIGETRPDRCSDAKTRNVESAWSAHPERIDAGAPPRLDRTKKPTLPVWADNRDTASLELSDYHIAGDRMARPVPVTIAR